MLRKSAIVGALILTVSLLPGGAVAAAPTNDDVGAATPVNGIPFDDSVAVGDATTEDGEPLQTCAPFADTVWYALTLPATSDVRIDTTGSDYDTTIAVWIGTGFDDFELVACNDDTFTSLQAATTITAEGGTTYLVQVGSFSGAPPGAVLTISFGEPGKATGQPFISKNSFRGMIAEASASEFDEETGTFSFRGVFVIDGRSQGKGMRPFQLNEVFVDSHEETFDEATGTLTFTSWSGGAQLSSGDYAIDRRLRNAFVTKELTLFGQTCAEDFGEEPAFECTFLGEVDVRVDVVWDGNGPIVTVRDRSSDSSDGFRFRFYGTSRSREAEVSGGVAGQHGFDLTGALGRIAKDANGSWFFARGETGFVGFGSPGTVFGDSRLASGMNEILFDKFRGGFAQAFDQEFTEETGEFRVVDVAYMSGRSQTKGDKWVSFDEVFVNSVTGSFDEETETFSSTEWFGGGPVMDGSVDTKLGGAAVTAEVTLFGQACTESFGDEPVFECTSLGETTVLVEVIWEGVGPAFTSRSSFDERMEDSHIRFTGRSTSRQALANGSVGGEIVSIDLTDATGFLARNANGLWMKG